MATQTTERAAARAALHARSRLREDLERLLADSGISPAALARMSGVDAAQISRMLAGKARPSLETYAKLGIPLGADLAARLYPNTGPTIRDRHQARIIEALLQMLGPTWRPFTEASVWKPVRGAIDAVLHDPRQGLVVAMEIESDLRRIEQTIRWAKEKTEALPSWSGWSSVLSASAAPLRTSQLLIVRRTRANERVAREFARQLALAYPAHPEDALASLRGGSAWPGSAMVWARIEKDGVKFLATR